MTDLLFDIETYGAKAKDALSPLRGRITCICCKSSGSDCAPVCFSGDVESRVIEDFLLEVSRVGPDRLVAYNGWSFDVPFLRVRAMKYGIRLPSIFWNDSKLIDPYHVLRRNQGGRQEEFAQLLGHSICGSGLECVGWFEKGEHNKIKEHCSSDIVALDAIYSAMRGAGF